ncbi:unnamed protein product [Cochlearia groenlandica]
MSNIVNVEGVESKNNSKEQERERRRQRDRERRQLMSQDEREKHLARRRKNYQLRRQRAETNRNDAHIGKRDQESLISPQDSGARSNVPLAENDESMELAKLMGTIRLSRMKHVARTLIKSSSTNYNDAESSNKGESNHKTTRCAMSSGPRLSHVKRMVRSNGQQDQELL